ncbi:MAG: hypothetical protein U0802_13960 [Candidatus Binatia bacterium]
MAKRIEDDLAAHPSVADVAVIGAASTAQRRAVCACVVLAPGAALTLADVRTFHAGARRGCGAEDP